MHAKDGEIYDFNGKSVIVIGGTYSVLAPSGMSITSTSGGIYFCEKQTIRRAGIYFSKLALGFPSQRRLSSLYRMRKEDIRREDKEIN